MRFSLSIALTATAVFLALGYLGLAERARAPAVQQEARSLAVPCERDPQIAAAVNAEQARVLDALRQASAPATTPGWLQEATVRLVAANVEARRITPHWRVSVLGTDELNAYSGSQGDILVTQGLLKSSLGRDEVVAVVAHEMAHVLLSHSLKRHCEEKALGSAQALYHPMEIAADRQATILLSEASYPPEALRGAVEKLHRTRGGPSSTPSHPSYLEREAALRSVLAPAP